MTISSRIAATAIVLTAALSGCSSGDVVESIPVEEAHTAVYREALAAIAPQLAEVSDQTLLNGGKSICRAITEGKGAQVLARDAANRFGVDEELGAAIVEVTRAHACPN